MRRRQPVPSQKTREKAYQPVPLDLLSQRRDPKSKLRTSGHGPRERTEATMRNLMECAVILAATVSLIGCGGDADSANGNGNGSGNGNGNGSGEPSGEGRYLMQPMGGDPYDITKTVLYHNLSRLGDDCFYSFRIAPDADQQVPDTDPFAQYIDVFYGNATPDDFLSGFVYRNAEYVFQGTPTRSPAEPSSEALATGTYNSGDTGENGSFEFVLDQNLSEQLPAVSTCVQ